MQRDLGETAECMKVPFSVPTWERVKIWHLVSKVRKPHPHADKGAENQVTWLLQGCKESGNSTYLQYNHHYLFKGSIYLKAGTLYPLRFMNFKKKRALCSYACQFAI